MKRYIRQSQHPQRHTVKASTDVPATVDAFNRKYGTTEYGHYELRDVDNESYDEEINYVLYEYFPEYDKLTNLAAFTSIDKAVSYVEYMDEMKSKDPIYNPKAKDVW